jgi:hypothetical protein
MWRFLRITLAVVLPLKKTLCMKSILKSIRLAIELFSPAVLLAVVLTANMARPLRTVKKGTGLRHYNFTTFHSPTERADRNRNQFKTINENTKMIITVI